MNNDEHPLADAYSAPFWAGVQCGELRLQQCMNCQAYQPIPRAHCSGCGHDKFKWVSASCQGRVASYTWVERGPTPAFREPYMLALIDLQEGPRLMMNIIGEDLQSVAIGDTVQIVFSKLTPDTHLLPQARRLGNSTSSPRNQT